MLIFAQNRRDIVNFDIVPALTVHPTENEI